MIDVVDVSHDEVVEDDAVPLKDVAKLLKIVGDDELENNADEWVCPDAEVLLFDDDIIMDDIDVL